MLPRNHLIPDRQSLDQVTFHPFPPCLLLLDSTGAMNHSHIYLERKQIPLIITLHRHYFQNLLYVTFTTDHTHHLHTRLPHSTSTVYQTSLPFRRVLLPRCHTFNRSQRKMPRRYTRRSTPTNRPNRIMEKVMNRDDTDPRLGTEEEKGWTHTLYMPRGCRNIRRPRLNLLRSGNTLNKNLHEYMG